MTSMDQQWGRRGVMSLRALVAAGLLTGMSMSTGIFGGALPTASAAATCASFTPAEVMQAAEEVADDVETDNGEDADVDTIAAAGAALANAVACWNAGDWVSYASLLSGNMLLNEYGAASAEEFAAQREGVAPLIVHVVEGDNVKMYKDGRVSVDVEYTIGDYGYENARWFYVNDNGQWRFDEEMSLPPDIDGDKAFVSFSVADDASDAVFDQRNSILAPEVLVLHGFNNGEAARSFDIYQLSAAPAEGEELTALPEDAMLIGGLNIKAGDQEDYALAGLAPGAYAIVASGTDVPALIVLEDPGM